MSIFTPKQGDFLNFATHFAFRCHDVVLFLAYRSLDPQVLCFQFVKQLQFVILLSIRYTTEITKREPVYLVNLATCILLAAEVTSHPHLGGDDNANPFRTTEALRGEPYL